jgi:hypothetical protein
MDSDVEYKKVSKKIPMENVCIQIENKTTNSGKQELTGVNLTSQLSPSLPISNVSSQLDSIAKNNNLQKLNDSNLLNGSKSDISAKSDRKILIIDDKNSKNIKIKLNQSENSNFLNNGNNLCSNSLITG